MVERALVTSFKLLPGNVEEPFRRLLEIPFGPDPGCFSRVLELSDLESSRALRIR